VFHNSTILVGEIKCRDRTLCKFLSRDLAHQTEPEEQFYTNTRLIVSQNVRTIPASAEEQSFKFSIKVVNKTAAIAVQFAKCILLHAYSRTIVAPSCASTNKNFILLVYMGVGSGGQEGRGPLDFHTWYKYRRLFSLPLPFWKFFCRRPCLFSKLA